MDCIEQQALRLLLVVGAESGEAFLVRLEPRDLMRYHDCGRWWRRRLATATADQHSSERNQRGAAEKCGKRSQHCKPRHHLRVGKTTLSRIVMARLTLRQ